jgi:SM-20-related protein
LTEGLVAEDVVIRDRFLTPSQVRALVQCAGTRRARGQFAPARIGSDRTLQRREDIRGDSTCWMIAPLFAAEEMLMNELEQVRLELNREALLGLFDLELHYAWYPPGTGYERHVDQPWGRTQRIVSLVLYLNETWKSGDGGVLRLFEDNDRHRDVEPVAGRLVYFLTAGREHEVLPTRRPRLSISGWFRTRACNTRTGSSGESEVDA